MAFGRGPRLAGRKNQSPARQTASRTGLREGVKTRRVLNEAQRKTGADQVSAKNKNSLPGIIIRILLVVTVFILMTIYFYGSIKAYFVQRTQIAQTQQEIIEHQAAIDRLQAEIDRWQDPAFVQIQARQRLGWVLPGETGYRVVGVDGKPYGGGAEIGEATLPNGEHTKTWWDRMWLSVQIADNPTGTEKLPEPIKAKTDDGNGENP